MYACKECGASAKVEKGVIVRSCSHTCGVTMDMGAACAGKGGMREVTKEERALAFFTRVGNAFMQLMMRKKHVPKKDA